jgi:hypothetical protein
MRTKYFSILKLGNKLDWRGKYHPHGIAPRRNLSQAGRENWTQ